MTLYTDADKHSLLNFLQASHGTSTTERKKITLTKKSTTEIKQADATGKARTIQVEVRKKRTFVRRDEAADLADTEISASAEPEKIPTLDAAELARREEEARRQADLIRRQEEELAERRRQQKLLEEQQARQIDSASTPAESQSSVVPEPGDESQAQEV